MKTKIYFIISLITIIILNNPSGFSQCTEDKEVVRYKNLTETQDAQGCSQCAMLALYFCSATYSVKIEDKRKVSALITACKGNIRNMGQPYCCPELLNKEPQWGIMGENVSSNSSSSNNTSATGSGTSYSRDAEEQNLDRTISESLAVLGLDANQTSVDNATELVGLVGNIISDASAANEKKRAAEETERARVKMGYLKTIKDNLHAANNGNPEAINKVAYAYFYLNEVSQSAKWYQKGIELDNSLSYYGMAQIENAKFFDGYRIKSMPSASALSQLNVVTELLEKAADRGCEKASCDLILYYLGIDPHYYENTFTRDIFSKAERKSMEFSFSMTWSINPWKKLKNENKVLEEAKKAELRGHYRALKIVSNYYTYGSNYAYRVSHKAESLQAKNKEDEFFKMMIQAADRYYPYALGAIAQYYEAKKDYELCFQYCKKVAVIGDVTGMKNLAKLYRSGRGIKTGANPEIAAEWDKKAKEKENILKINNYLGVN